VKTTREIVIEIDYDTGEIKAEASGYEGEACSIDMNALLKGQVITETKHKDPRKDRKVATIQRT